MSERYPHAAAMVDAAYPDHSRAREMLRPNYPLAEETDRAVMELREANESFISGLDRACAALEKLGAALADLRF